MVVADETEDRGDPDGENIVIGSNWSRHITLRIDGFVLGEFTSLSPGVRRTVIIIIGMQGGGRLGQKCPRMEISLGQFVPQKRPCVRVPTIEHFADPSRKLFFP